MEPRRVQDCRFSVPQFRFLGGGWDRTNIQALVQQPNELGMFRYLLSKGFLRLFEGGIVLEQGVVPL